MSSRSDDLDEIGSMFADTRTPRVDAVIEQFMRRFPGVSKSHQARYYEEVHQELAPLSRQLEIETIALRAEIESLKQQLRAAGQHVALIGRSE